MPKKPTHKTTPTLIADGISMAFGEFEDLASSMREWFDNCNENLQQSDKMQTVEQTADTLEGLSEPDLPEWITGGQDSDEGIRFDHVEANITPLAHSRRSRATRCSDAYETLNQIVEKLNQLEEEEEKKGAKKDQDRIDEISSLRDELENAVSEAEGCEFPGMYG